MSNVKQKTYVALTGYIFGFIGCLHLARLILGWEAIIAGWSVPIWLSLVASTVGFYLAYNAFGYKK